MTFSAAILAAKSRTTSTATTMTSTRMYRRARRPPRGGRRMLRVTVLVIADASLARCYGIWVAARPTVELVQSLRVQSWQVSHVDGLNRMCVFDCDQYGGAAGHYRELARHRASRHVSEQRWLAAQRVGRAHDGDVVWSALHAVRVRVGDDDPRAMIYERLPKRELAYHYLRDQRVAGRGPELCGAESEQCIALPRRNPDHLVIRREQHPGWLAASGCS